MKTQNCIKLRDLPENLQNIPSPPQQLWHKGAPLDGLYSSICLSVIGSRTITPYGRSAMSALLPDVIRAGVTVVSGLALGADALAHQTAIEYGGRTIAILPSSVNEIYPATNRQLAQAIIHHEGALLSEYPDGTDARRENFIARNRLVSGLSKALLIIEAAEKSGTLHTANFALEQGRDVLVVPGNITSPHSAGTNNLIKAGATPVTNSQDILRALGIDTKTVHQEIFAQTPEEQLIIDLLNKGVIGGTDLLADSQLAPSVFNQTLTMLEIRGIVKPLGNDQWTMR